MWLALLATLFLHGSSTNDYPIDPASLRILCDNADLIIVGEALEIRELPAREDLSFRDSHEVQLALDEILMGEIQNQEIVVPYPGFFGCPSPPHFEVGKKHLVFLEKNEDQTFAVCYLSYGGKVLGNEGLAAYKKAIFDYQEISQIKNEKIRDAATAEWIVQLALNPHTQWEGALELNEDRYLATGFTKDLWGFGISKLNSSQVERLIQCMADKKVLEFRDAELLEALDYSDDIRLLEPTLGIAELKWRFYRRSGMWLWKAVCRSNNSIAKELYLKKWRSSEDDPIRWYHTGGKANFREDVCTIAALIREGEKKKNM